MNDLFDKSRAVRRHGGVNVPSAGASLPRRDTRVITIRGAPGIGSVMPAV